MALSLPPLTALRAFEAAARHLSFAAAADELSVTPAALSFQIKSLEQHLGTPLFVRRNRAVELTEAGRALAPGAASGFETLRQAWQAAQRALQDDRLTVTAGPGFTAKWLAPRLGEFARLCPDIEIRIASTLNLLDFARDGVDVAIRFGQGDDAGLFSEHLSDEWVTPMMRPEIAARLHTPADLLAETLIHDDSMAFLKRRPGWADWLTAAGIAAPLPGGLTFSQADHVIDVAVQGLGVALGRFTMARQALRTGALVAPFTLALAVPAHARIVCPLGHESRPAVARFRDWLKAEAAADADLRAGRHLLMLD
ncbi:MAG: transcriptional regulator GcvA [Pseudomonadota bacterium]